MTLCILIDTNSFSFNLFHPFDNVCRIRPSVVMFSIYNSVFLVQFKYSIKYIGGIIYIQYKDMQLLSTNIDKHSYDSSYLSSMDHTFTEM
jgi:hypothetical protein